MSEEGWEDRECDITIYDWIDEEGNPIKPEVGEDDGYLTPEELAELPF